jgi:parallel beta-helix repeat protein
MTMRRTFRGLLVLSFMLSGVFASANLSIVHAAGTTYYIATADNGGNDSNPGTQDQPFLTINHAANLTNPGDIVVVGDGTYQNAPGQQTVLHTNRSGAPDSYISFKAQHQFGAKLVNVGGFDAVLVESKYIEINGFDVTSDGATNDCINAYNTSYIRIIGNHTHDCASYGIQALRGDYYWIEGNVVNNNAATSPNDASGISINLARATDDAPGFHIVIRNNVVFSNLEAICGACQHTDGNGIIIDDFRNEPERKGIGVNYPAQTLVENNLTYNNGGGGIHVYRTDHVTVRNNTVYANYADSLDTTTWRGELTNIQGSDNHWYNNVAIANTTLGPNHTAIVDAAFSGSTNTGVTWYSNLTFNGTPGDPSIKIMRSDSVITAANGNLLGVDPQMVGIGVTSDANFHLQPGSPAIGAGTTGFGVPGNDLDGKPRQSTIVDIGCYETYQPQ